MEKCTDVKTKEVNLSAVFDDNVFKDDLEKVRIEIEREIKRFMSYLKENLNDNQKIFENIESRIKSKNRFVEKLYRKNYIYTWDVYDDLQENQKTICMKLSDLIGFRINCFFWQDEELIYSLLKKYYDEKLFKNIELDFNENRKQKNGHIINKVSGMYFHQNKRNFCFEIQIKSIMHNIWGEVDHKTIYKNTGYDLNFSEKKTITEELFNILRASDKQLMTLLNEKQNEKELIMALFYEKSKQQISQKCHTDILGEYYSSYFKVFANIDAIKDYLSCVLIGKKYNKREIKYDCNYEQFDELKLSIKTNFAEYKLQGLYYIHELLYAIPSYECFLNLLSKHLHDLYFNYKFDSFDEYDDFDEFDDVEIEEEQHKDCIEDILIMLGNKIGEEK